MKPVSPVIEGLEPYEVRIGGPENNQPEFMPLPALRSPDGKTMSRWQLNEEDREMIAAGADVYIIIATNGIHYPPTMVQVLRADEGSEHFKEYLALDDALDLRMLQDDFNTTAKALDEKRLALEAKAKEICQKLHIGNQSPNSEGTGGSNRAST